MGEAEEIVHPFPKLVHDIRSKLIKFFEDLAQMDYDKVVKRVTSSIFGVGCVRAVDWIPGRLAVVDGGSNIISMNAGFLGICCAVAVLIRNCREVYLKEHCPPETVPEEPADLVNFETLEQVSSVVDKLREAMVFELALKIIREHPVDLLIIDGPLIPYGALAKIVTGGEYERNALQRYREAVLKLLEEAKSKETPVIGFVKRPRSTLLFHMGLIDDRIYDHIALSHVLKEGQYYPYPPEKIEPSPGLIHVPEILEVVEKMKPSFTFLRLTEGTAPFRIDFLNVDQSLAEKILSFLYRARTRDGVPYPVMKADEETKVSRKLIMELYDDALHHYIVKMIRRRVTDITSALPLYGE